MIADDVFRSRLQATIASLRYWVPTIADAAHVEQTEDHDFWKLAVTPNLHGPCPFELMLRADQHFDLAVAGETYEDQPITSLALFVPLVEAISSGRIVQRHISSSATRAGLALETRITLDDGTVWTGRRTLPGGDVISDGSTEVSDRHFLPYHRRTR